MALHLQFSNQILPLLDRFSEQLDDTWQDLSQPPAVVIPSPAVAKWLKIRLCERRKALVGLPTLTLENFLWESLEPQSHETLLRSPVLAHALVPHLEDAALDPEKFQDVRRFLLRDGAIDPSRRLQLAQELARLFLEYEYNRPSVWSQGRWSFSGIDQHWPDKPWFFPEQENPMETWQRTLFGKVFAEEAMLAQKGYLTLPRLHQRQREKGWIPKGRPVFLFLIDRVSHFHRNMLMELSETRDVFLFLQNPCSEFWEDVDTRSARQRIKRDSCPPRFTPEEYAADTLSQRSYPAQQDEQNLDPLLLQAWGRTSRENISLWCQNTEYDFAFEVAPTVQQAEEATVLKVLQQSLLLRNAGPVYAPLELDNGDILDLAIEQDSSLQILACPERGREMEAIRDSITQWLSEDPSHSPADVLVLLPDPTRHESEVHRVFGGLRTTDPGFLPWTFLGSQGKDSQWARGVLALLDLLLHGLNRPRVFSLLRNPLCWDRLGIDAETLGHWEKWADGTGMIRGWDSEDRRRTMQDALAEDVHTFRTGLLRLMTAKFSDEPVALPLKSQAELTNIPSWRDFDSSDADAIESFAETLERLQLDLSELRVACSHSSPHQIGQILSEICDGWMLANQQESPIRREFLQSLHVLSFQDARQTQMDLPEFCDAIKALLPEEIPGSARAFAGSITFAPLRIGNVLPHKLLIVAGLEADAFPRSVQQNTLNLLAQTRKIGDAEISNDDRHAFLSAVLAAQERLVLLWRHEDIQKEREIEPSSVLLTLRDALKGVIGEVVDPTKRVTLLARESNAPSRYWPNWSVRSWDPHDAFEPKKKLIVLEHSDAPIDVHYLSLANIRSFVQDAFTFHCQRNLGLREEEPTETLQLSDEPLAMDALTASMLQKQLFPYVCRNVWDGFGQSLEALVEQTHATIAWNSQSPEGELSQAEKSSLLEWARELENYLKELHQRLPNWQLLFQSDFSLGDPQRAPQWQGTIPDIGVFEIQGHIDCALISPPEQPKSAILLGLGRLDKFPTDNANILLHLQAALLQACGFDGTIELLYFHRKVVKKKFVLSILPNPALLQSWLSHILTEIGQGKSDFLPFKHVGSQKEPNLEALRDAIDEDEYLDVMVRLLHPKIEGEETQEERLYWERAQARFAPFMTASKEVEEA